MSKRIVSGFRSLGLKFLQGSGRKVSDLAFAELLCHACGSMNEALNLEDRHWRCACGRLNERDHNAAMNIEMEGACSIGLEGVRLASASGPCLTPESHER
jgi:hypothetical protein